MEKTSDEDMMEASETAWPIIQEADDLFLVLDLMVFGQ